MSRCGRSFTRTSCTCSRESWQIVENSSADDRMNKILANHVRDPDEIANSQGDVKPKTEGLSKSEIDYSDDDDD